MAVVNIDMDVVNMKYDIVFWASYLSVGVKNGQVRHGSYMKYLELNKYFFPAGC